MDEGALLPAHEGARPLPDLYVEVEFRSEDVVSQQAVLPCLGDGGLRAPDRQGIFGPDIEISMGRAHGVGGDGHPLDDGMRVRFEYAAVHVGPGVPFVAIADEVFRGLFLRPADLPFSSRRETGASPPSQPRLLDFLDHVFRFHPAQDFFQRGVAVPGDAFVETARVDDSPVPQHDGLLFPEERNPGQLGPDPECVLPDRGSSLNVILENPYGLVRGDVPVQHDRPAGRFDGHHRLLRAHPGAPGGGKPHVPDAVLPDFLREGREDLAGARRYAARAHMDRDPSPERIVPAGDLTPRLFPYFAESVA